MTTADVVTPTIIPAVDERTIRATAMKRSWICPGAGFAFIGRGPLAVATYAANLCGLPAFVWLTFEPNGLSLAVTLAVIVVATGLWLFEQIGVTRMTLNPPSPQVLVRRIVPASCTMVAAMILALGFLVTGFGSLGMGGSGMMPTLKKGERLLYHKHVDWQRVTPGAIIVYKNADDSAWGQPGWLVISRILAGPGDRLSIKDDNYLVNGIQGPKVAETGSYKAIIHVLAEPEATKVPDKCYFIVQDSPSGGFDSRVLSWVRTDKIVGSRLWYLSGRGVFKAVE